MTDFQSFHDILKNLDTVEHSGKVMKVVGLTVESNGPAVNMGNICRIYPSVGDDYVEAEVVGFNGERLLLMPASDTAGLAQSTLVAPHEPVALRPRLDRPAHPWRRAADRMEELRFIDDGRYAGMVARHYASKGYGLRRIREEFYRRGVPREVWEAALEDLEAPDETLDRLLPLLEQSSHGAKRTQWLAAKLVVVALYPFLVMAVFLAASLLFGLPYGFGSFVEVLISFEDILKSRADTNMRHQFIKIITQNVEDILL